MERQLPALRGLAIAVVALVHSIIMTTEAAVALGFVPSRGWDFYALKVFSTVGIFAVPTFLFVSGSFFAYTARGTNPRLNYKTVWMGLERLLLPYLIWSVVFYLTVYVVDGMVFTPADYFKNILVGYPFHFVPLIAFYYLLAPILVRLSRHLGWILVGAIALYQLLLVGLMRPGVLGVALPDWMWWLAPKVLRGTLADWGVYFPLGMVYCLRSQGAAPILYRMRWVLRGVTAILFVVSALDAVSILDLRLAAYVAPIAFALSIPSISRDSVPFVRLLEKFGKRSYGIYLTHLTLLYVALIPIKMFAPSLLDYGIVLTPLLFGLVVGIPYLAMEYAERARVQRAYRYVFG